VSAKQRDAVFRRLYDAVWTYDASGNPASLLPFLEKLNQGLPLGKETRRPLHWPLVFPEVFADTGNVGLNGLVGNPAFLGGTKISGALGSDYLAWLQQWDGQQVKGNADLAARFLLRADALLSGNGQLGFVTTNSVLEGDSLDVGLLQLHARGWVLRRGTSAHAWPSSGANLSIVELWCSKARMATQAVLDDEPVPNLGPDLEPFLREQGRPQVLQENQGIAFNGSKPDSVGFTLDTDLAQALTADDSALTNVLFPYLIGADVNRRHDGTASRWIINFHDWSLERAANFPDQLEQVRRLVKPERDRNNRAARRDAWWRYAERAGDLYAAIASKSDVLALSRVGNTLLPMRVGKGFVFSDGLIVFALEDFASLALLSSSIHQTWVIRYTSTMRSDLRYAPSDVFLTLPRPVPTAALADLGVTLDRERRELMLERALGLTKLYNLVHDPAVHDPAIVGLRDIHSRIDAAVLAAYGWDDLDPDIGHHPTKIGIRWTVSPKVRFELLDRLLVENHRRAATQQ
jgi:hypothetical protein